jgi:hypothetical protein
MKRLRYEPFRPGASPSDAIVVGGPPPAALHLSHWPGNATPPALKADTSLEIVLKFLNLKGARREALRRGAEIATSPCFGADPLLALWSLLAPHRAQGFTGPLQAAAFSGEFKVFVFPEATKICCAIYRLGDPERSPLRGELGGADPWERLGALHRALLPRLDEVLGYPDRFAADWSEEFEAIQADRRLFGEGRATVEEFPDVDLAVIRAPRPLHPVARNSAMERLRVLTIAGQATYELTYRAETWVEFVSRPVPARIDLAPLLPELQALESAGTWVFDGIARPVPALRCADPAGAPGPSAIAPDRFLDILRRYLAAHAAHTAYRWNPGAPHPELQSRVPSP